MKHIQHILCVAAIAACMCSCGLFGGGDVDNSPKESDLIGRWWAVSQVSSDTMGRDSIVFAFLNEVCDRETADGKWGYTYDEGDDVHLSDVMNKEEDGDYHGNGWFGWTLDGYTIQTYQTFSSSDAVTPYQYKITSLTSSTLVLTEGKRTYTLSKVR